MKTLQYQLIAISIIIVISLYGHNSVFAADSDSDSGKAERSSAEALQQETTEALAALKDYTVEQRDDMVKDAKQLLTYLDQRIDRLSQKIEAQSESYKDAIRAQWRDTLQALRRQRMETAEWVGGLQYSSKEAWEEVKTGFVQAYQNLSDALRTEEDRMDEQQSALLFERLLSKNIPHC